MHFSYFMGEFNYTWKNVRFNVENSQYTCIGRLGNFRIKLGSKHFWMKLIIMRQQNCNKVYLQLLSIILLPWNHWVTFSKTFSHKSSFGLSLFGCLIVCLFVLRIFHSYGDVTIAGEGLQILTYAWYSWRFSSEGSVACHTYWDTEHPFIMVISEDP